MGSFKKKKGVTVLVCTHNGGNNLKTTLLHLAKQNVDAHLDWEILLINNASTDNTREVALQVWNDFKSVVSFTVVDEPETGKDRAMDLGLSLAKYSYAIVCDDDNWLCDTYVQNSFTIMEGNPQIGMLGGKGVPSFEGTPPKWFTKFQNYYAVGSQSIVSGEIKHFWPAYRFIWGAGSVINMEAYSLLKRAGFSRILTQKKYPKVARSEDLELCFAIWLTGYKIWYEKKLVYQHYISNDRLKWNYFLKVVKQSIPASHYLKPYNILIFTGPANTPKQNSWLQHIKPYIRLFYHNCKSIENWKNLGYFILGLHKENELYFRQAQFWYMVFGILQLGAGYNDNFKRVLRLQKRLAEMGGIKTKLRTERLSKSLIQR